MRKNKKNPRTVRLNDLENIVDDHLKKTGDNFSIMVKKALVFYLESDRPKVEISLDEIVEELKKMRGNLSRVGGNLNQISFHFNTTGIVQENALAKSHENLRNEFSELIKFFRKYEQLLLDYKG
jgi:hypothetical protein